MQSMNQSLAALVLHQAVTRETALEVSAYPGDLDLMLRKLTYAEENGEEGPDMTEPLSDFSKILELQEIRKAYDELEETSRQQLREREEEIQRLRDELASHDGAATEHEPAVEQLRNENERLNGQISVIRQEYEAKIERLNARIKDLSGGSSPPSIPAARAPEESRRGFFRR
jgi:DNA repair exonuclease SbcCD ATPase subunit